MYLYKFILFVFIWISWPAGSLRHDIDPAVGGRKPLCPQLPQGKGGAACNHTEPGQTNLLLIYPDNETRLRKPAHCHFPGPTKHLLCQPSQRNLHKIHLHRAQRVWSASHLSGKNQRKFMSISFKEFISSLKEYTSVPFMYINSQVLVSWPVHFWRYAVAVRSTESQIAFCMIYTFGHRLLSLLFHISTGGWSKIKW